MTGIQTLEARTALGLAAGAATVAVSRWGTLYRLPQTRFDRIYLPLFAGVRLLLFVLIFLVLRLPVRGDVYGYYIPELLERLKGGVPYRDFGSSYAPLLSYGNAALYRLHASPLTLVLFAILVEIIAAAVWLRVLRGCAPDATVRLAALLCLVNPVSLQFVTVDGQNNVLLSLCLALALLALLRRHAAASGTCLAAAIGSVKFLPLLFVPAFTAYTSRRRWPWLAACGALLLAVYGGFEFVLHAPVLSALGREGGIKSASGVPFVAEALLGRDLGLRSWDALVLVLLAAAVLHTARLASRTGVLPEAVRVRMLMASCATVMLTLMAFSKKTWPTYTEIILFPLAVAVAARGERKGRLSVWLFAVFSVIAVTAQSVWSSVLNQASALQVHAALAQGRPNAWGFTLLEMALLALYLWLIAVCLREERTVTSLTAG